MHRSQEAVRRAAVSTIICRGGIFTRNQTVKVGGTLTEPHIANGGIVCGLFNSLIVF